MLNATTPHNVYVLEGYDPMDGEGRVAGVFSTAEKAEQAIPEGATYYQGPEDNVPDWEAHMIYTIHEHTINNM